MAPRLTPGTRLTSLKDTMSRLNEAWNVVVGRQFNPGMPLQPQTSIEEQTQGPRAYQFPMTSNLQTRPRGEYPQLTPFEQLRNLARLYDVAALCIDARIEQIIGLDWSIAAIDKKDQQGLEDSGAVKKAKTFFETPDPEQGRDFNDWLTALLREVLEIDALSIYVQRDRAGRLYGLQLIDGATVKPLIDDRGLIGGYQQVLHGAAFSQYRKHGMPPGSGLPLTNSDGTPVTQELIYRPRKVRADNVYGFSPTEFVIMRINTALRKQNFDLRYFTDGNIPEMLISPPAGNMSVEQVAQFEEYFNAVLTGDDAARRKAKFLAWPAQVQMLKQFSYDTTLDEWMLKLTCAAYGVTPSEIGFTNHVNRATSDGQQDITYRKAIKPLAKWLKGLFDRIIQIELREPKLEFVWKFSEVEDNLTKAQELQIYLSSGVISPDEVRAMQFSGMVEGPAPGLPGAGAGAGVESDPELENGPEPFQLPAPSEAASLPITAQEAAQNGVTPELTQKLVDAGVLGDEWLSLFDKAEASTALAISKIFDLDTDTEEDTGLDLEKRWRGGGGRGGIGSRGGKVYTDSKGNTIYGTPPSGNSRQAHTAVIMPLHNPGSKHAGSGSGHKAGVGAKAAKPHDYRTTKSPRQTLAHLDRIIKAGKLPNGQHLSEKDLNSLRFLATSMRTDLHKLLREADESVFEKGSNTSLAWTDKEMTGMSLITEADKQAASRLWKRNAPPLYRNLLQAVPVGAGADDTGEGEGDG